MWTSDTPGTRSVKLHLVKPPVHSSPIDSDAFTDISGYLTTCPPARWECAVTCLKTSVALNEIKCWTPCLKGFSFHPELSHWTATSLIQT